MTLVLKRVQPNHFEVIHDREIVGRIYRMIGEEELWRWTAPGPREPTDGPSGGICTSFDQDKAAFQRAWDAHGCPLSGEADKKSSWQILRLWTLSRHSARTTVV
jgi:hypothetical protein